MHIYAEFHSLHSALLPRNRNELEVQDLLLNGVKEKEAPPTPLSPPPLRSSRLRQGDNLKCLACMMAYMVYGKATGRYEQAQKRGNSMNL